MINNVRNTVLAIINKENNGYITPEEFNLFCTMAQLEIFEDYFYQYTRWIVRQNQRLSNSEYSDIPANLREKIDIFSTETELSYDTDRFIVPSDIYRVETVFYSNPLVASPDVEVEEVSKRRIKYLISSNLNTPIDTYPVYIRLDNDIQIYPTSITSGVSCYGIRKPLTPKWTYLDVSGNPVFNISATDYQDLEIHPSDETKLIIKVLSYSGISIREEDIVQVMENLDTKDFQKENS